MVDKYNKWKMFWYVWKHEIIIVAIGVLIVIHYVGTNI